MQQFSLVAMYWREEKRAGFSGFSPRPLSVLARSFLKAVSSLTAMLVETSRERRDPRGAQLHNLSLILSAPPGALVQSAAENVQPSAGWQQFKAAGWSWGRALGGGGKRWSRDLRWIPRICTYTPPIFRTRFALSRLISAPARSRGGKKVRQGLEMLHLITNIIRLTHRFITGAGRSFTLTAQGKATVAIWIICTNYQLPNNKWYFGIK